MIIRTLFDTQKDRTVTIEYEDGEPLPVSGEVMYFDGYEDEGFEVGRILYDKYNVRTYEIVGRHVIAEPFDEDEWPYSWQ